MGSIKFAYINGANENVPYGMETGQIYAYSFMDSAQVFFLDAAYGPELTLMGRKSKNGIVTQYEVPVAIEYYNKLMNGVDAIDQIRNGRFSFVMKHSNKKYTKRIFTGLDEFATTNAYNF